MTEPEVSPKIQKKFRKGDLIKVNRQAYENSLEALASDTSLPEYIFEGPGELLLVKNEYCQVRWRRPVPDVWLRSDQLEEWVSSE
ncbi:NAD(P)H-quinone oxidoreductase subunit O [Prochlorococcus sp. MIT 1223]|uniref:NAD(P)H-quinone oxidoreductase subunit O n=1 Tax=Prochlorococcus sp. MIT 1223 TaxID=3096217 RepID=UPI002A75EC2F|nr:NAD(P)H-quinone oxidoreductase subunit O [Prochlorococcus sp. MIT 1223]